MDSGPRVRTVHQKGERVIKKFYIAMVDVKLDTERLRRLTQVPRQLRLLPEKDWKTSRVALQTGLPAAGRKVTVYDSTRLPF